MSKIDYTNTFILNSLKLPVIKTIDEFSNNLGISKEKIFLFTRHTEKFYKKFNISKRDGISHREIQAPNYWLKLTQKWILKKILYKIDTSEHLFAYKKGINGVKENAVYHQYSIFLLQMDIKDFFPSIKREKIFFLFRNLGYNIVISNLLTNLCTYENQLPQGGVTSPYLSNLICFRMDRRLSALCSKRDILYTRFADDLTFSADNRNNLLAISNVIKRIVENEDYQINNKKTRLLSPKNHKLITGITTNDSRVKANKKLKRKVRAMIHFAIATGNYNNVSQIKGYISFISSIENDFKQKIEKYISKLLIKDYKLFSDLVDSFNSSELSNSNLLMQHSNLSILNQAQFKVNLGNKHFTLDERFILKRYGMYPIKKQITIIDIYNKHLEYLKRMNQDVSQLNRQFESIIKNIEEASSAEDEF